MKRFVFVLLVLIIIASAIIGCDSKANVASKNLSKSADNFEVFRRIVFYNGITDTYVAVIEGYCSLGNSDLDGELSVICKLEDGTFIKDFEGLSDNMSYFVIQLNGIYADTHHYRVFFNPSTAIPDVDLVK